ncbi:cytochrome P450 CYP749A22-like [Tripterygium wilfordii]|uniref:cytochrome P450 CYP749A22-like n=1 Tax=Tripterygium wilfordii TaxID=458696 RepID=UPI0018F82589|nr:cytochrome P450 CYP749A22-like [Tripterygium wilfordii]
MAQKIWTEFPYVLYSSNMLGDLKPELMKETLNNKDGTYSRITPDYINKLAGDGLHSSVGRKWSKMRKLPNHAFHAESLKNMIPPMIVGTKMMLER